MPDAPSAILEIVCENTIVIAEFRADGKAQRLTGGGAVVPYTYVILGVYRFDRELNDEAPDDL